jgi:hypothetical protein
MLGVCGVSVYTILRLKSAERWLLEAREAAPVKKIANLDAYATTLRKEFTTLLDEVEEKHDRWRREMASLRSYIHRRIGKEEVGGSSEPTDQVPERISASDPRAVGGSESIEGTDPRTVQKRAIKEAYFAARRS